MKLMLKFLKILFFKDIIAKSNCLCFSSLKLGFEELHQNVPLVQPASAGMFDGVMDPAPESTKIRWKIEITGTITTDSYYPYTMVTDLGPRGGRQVWPRLPGVEVQGWCPLPLWTHNMTIYSLINIGNPHTIYCMCFSKLIAITFISTFFLLSC